MYYDLLNDNLSKSTIVLFTLLLSNSNQKGYAFRSNKYYAEKLKCTTRTISSFSARMYIEYTYKIKLRVGKDAYVEGIPKGYIDKNDHRQNYIHILKINDLEVNKEPPLYGDGYWNGKKIEDSKASPEEQAEMQRIIDEITGGK